MAKPRLLYFLHCYYNRAGTEQHVKDLTQGLKDEFDIWTVFREHAYVMLLNPDGSQKQWIAEAPQWPLTPYHQPEAETVLRQVLEEVKPELIHLHHFHNWPLSVIDILTGYGAKTLFTCHDYYLVTPYFTMQGVRGAEECFSPEYAKQFFRADITEYLRKRVEVLKKSLPRITVVIGPSRFVVDEIAKVHDIQPVVIEHGIKPFEVMPRQHSSLVDMKALKFGFIGSLLPQKGWDVLARAFPRVRKAAPQATLHFFGGVAQMPGSEDIGITFHGVYEQEELSSITSQIDVGIIPSIFPETFCLTLSELWHGRVPAATSRIGALTARIRDGENGKLFTPGSVDEVASTLLWFVENESWKEWIIPQPRLLTEMLKDYSTLYKSLL